MFSFMSFSQAALCVYIKLFSSADDLARMYTTYSLSAAIHRLDVYAVHPDIISTFFDSFCSVCVIFFCVCEDNGLVF